MFHICKNGMIQTNELNPQSPKLDNFKQVKKMGLKAIMQDKGAWPQVEQIIYNTLHPTPYEDVYEINNKLWHEVIQFNHDFDVCKELKSLFVEEKLKTIYTQYLSNRSDYNGNHGQITMQYGKDYQIHSIRLHCIGIKETKNGFVYLRHGGNYSFEHDVVTSLNYLLFGNSEGFRQESL